MKKRKDGRYSTTITVGYDDLGKRQRVTVYGSTKAELMQNKAKVLVDLDKGIYIRDKSITFGEYSRQWLADKKISVTDVTMYEQVLRLHTSALDDIPLTQVTLRDCQDVINANADKPRTCQKIKITLNQVFERAIQANLLYKNPCRGIILPKYKSAEKRALTASEKHLLDMVQFTLREQMYINLIRYYGLRKEEALALKKSDFDFDSQILKVEHAVKFISNRPTEKETKTGKNRYLMMFPYHIETFMAFLLCCDDEDPHIFRNLQDGKWITQQSFRRMYAAIMSKLKNKAVELGEEVPENLTSHIFRHGFATDLYYAGVGLKDAQYLLGHSTASVTMDIYTHLDKRRTDARDKLMTYHEKD